MVMAATRMVNTNARRQTRDFNDGIDLRKSTDTEESDEDAEESEQESQGLVFFA